MAKKGKKNGKDKTYVEEAPAAVVDTGAPEMIADGAWADTGDDGAADERYTKEGKLRTSFYEAEMLKLQEELVKLQYWVKERGLRPARAAASSASPRQPTRASFASSPWASPATARGTPGTSSAGWPSYPRRARCACSTAAGIRGPSPSTFTGSATKSSTASSWLRARSSNGCSCAPG